MTHNRISSRLTTPAEDTPGAGVDVEAPGIPAGLPTHLPLWQQVFVLAIWPFLDALMIFLVGFVDTALAGRLDPASMDAIGAAGYLVWLMGIMQGSLGIGATAVVARQMGAGRTDQANHATAQAIMMATIWGSAILVAYLVATPALARMFGLEPAAAAHFSRYLSIVALAAPLRAVLYVTSACLRGAGDTRSPFFVMLIVNVVNILISVALVLGGMGVAGIAWGTTLAWSGGMILMSALVWRGLGRIRVRGHLLKPHRDMSGRILRIGIPSLFENGGHWLGNFFVAMMVGFLPHATGEDHTLGTHIIAIRIEALCFMPAFAVGIAASTLAGQYLGARNPTRAKHAVWICWAYGASASVLVGISFILFPHAYVRIITDEPVFMNTAPTLLFIAGWVQIGFATYLVLSGALRGAGDTRWTMMLTFGSTFLVRLPLAWWIGLNLGHGLVGIWLVLSGELLVRGVLFLARFLHGGWTKIEV